MIKCFQTNFITHLIASKRFYYSHLVKSLNITFHLFAPILTNGDLINLIKYLVVHVFCLVCFQVRGTETY